jgi:hypothetical protein
VVHAFDVNLLRSNINAINKNTRTLKYSSLDVNTEKTKYTLMYDHQNAGQSHNKDSYKVI